MAKKVLILRCVTYVCFSLIDGWISGQTEQSRAEASTEKKTQGRQETRGKEFGTRHRVFNSLSLLYLSSGALSDTGEYQNRRLASGVLVYLCSILSGEDSYSLARE